MRIIFENIIKGYEDNFKIRKYKMDEVENLVTPYDLQSIMHYPMKAFSSNDQNTIGKILGNSSFNIGPTIN